MIPEKKALLIWRAVLGGVFTLFVLLTVIISAVPFSGYYLIYLVPYFIALDVSLLAMFISSLLLSCKIYNYNGNEIIVFAGWYRHYIKINGEKHDEHNTFVSFTPIILTCSLDDGANIKATITLSSRITLKINDRIYFDK